MRLPLFLICLGILGLYKTIEDLSLSPIIILAFLFFLMDIAELYKNLTS